MFLSDLFSAIAIFVSILALYFNRKHAERLFEKSKEHAEELFTKSTYAELIIAYDVIDIERPDEYGIPVTTDIKKITLGERFEDAEEIRTLPRHTAYGFDTRFELTFANSSNDKSITNLKISVTSLIHLEGEKLTIPLYLKWQSRSHGDFSKIIILEPLEKMKLATTNTISNFFAQAYDEIYFDFIQATEDKKTYNSKIVMLKVSEKMRLDLIVKCTYKTGQIDSLTRQVEKTFKLKPHLYREDISSSWGVLTGWELNEMREKTEMIEQKDAL